MPNLVRLKRAFGWGSGHTRPYGWPGEITSVTTLTLAPTTTTTQPPAQPPQTQTATVTTAIVVTSPVVVTTSPEPPSTSSTPASSPTDTTSESGSPRSTTSRSSGRSFSSSTFRSNRASPTSVADHAPSESPASETVIYHTVSGTVTQTVASVASGPTIVAADTTASQPRSMNAGEKAAIAIACIFVFLLTVVIFFMWRKKKSQREHQRIHCECLLKSLSRVYIILTNLIRYSTYTHNLRWYDLYRTWTCERRSARNHWFTGSNDPLPVRRLEPFLDLRRRTRSRRSGCCLPRREVTFRFRKSYRLERGRTLSLTAFLLTSPVSSQLGTSHLPRLAHITDVPDGEHGAHVSDHAIRLRPRTSTSPPSAHAHGAAVARSPDAELPIHHGPDNRCYRTVAVRVGQPAAELGVPPWLYE